MNHQINKILKRYGTGHVQYIFRQGGHTLILGWKLSKRQIEELKQLTAGQSVTIDNQ